jgi:NAD(P)-dependent dehydrogenase (short-subunit alcohol dehydrogenase family)
LLAYGNEVVAVKVDLRDEEGAEALIEATAGAFGRIDSLVNNAAIVTHFAWSRRWPVIRDMEYSFWF